MKTRIFILAITLLLIADSFAFADRQLEKAEILQLFETLTNQPKNTWLPAGTIEATHLEYKASEGYIIESTVMIRYDGDRFYWEINIIDSYTEQTQTLGSPRSKSSRSDLDLNWNKKRVFAWDGQQYTRYFRPGNQAIVNEGPSDIPVAVNGPLTAGIIPWGYGVYTLESLLAAESSAIEVDVNGCKQLHLTLKITDMPEMFFVLDPAKDYAALSYLMTNIDRSSIAKTYEDYKLVAGRWIPTTIIIKRYDDSKQPPELLSYDEWDITSIGANIPPSDSFSIEYEAGALVECYLPVTDRPLSYRYSSRIDADSLLQDRLVIALASDTQTQNCATAAMKYISAQLGKNIAGQQLAELINDPNEGTSLHQLQQFARRLGFYCLAVKTDIQTLRTLKPRQVILHLPGPNHYVVLEHIDDEYIWLIDLDSNKFYYRTRLDVFDLDWTDGTALLISDEPLYLQTSPTELNGDQMREIIGGSPKYSCSDLIQEEDIVFCPEPVGGLCGGRYRKLHNLWGCEPNDMGGSCTGTGMVGNESSPCINDPKYPWECIITGEWYSQYIRACEP